MDDYFIDRTHKRLIRVDEFKHHGIEGQRWGVITRNVGVNYIPIGRRSVEKQMAVLGSLSKTMDNDFEYGVKIDGKKYYDMNKVDFSKYRTTPISELEKDKIGTCWDFVNYQHAVLDKNGIPNDNYMFVSKLKDGSIQTHTFTIAKVGEQQKWIESAMWSMRGVHDVSSYKDVAKELLNGDERAYDIYKYNPTGMDKGLTDQEYFDKATTNLLETSQVGTYYKIK